MIEEKKDKETLKFPDPIPDPLFPDQPRAEKLFGLFQTVVTAPTQPPKNYLDQIQLLTDSLTSPTTYTLYFYSAELNVWKSVALT